MASLQEILAKKKAAEKATLAEIPPGNYTAQIAAVEVTPNGGINPVLENIKPLEQKTVEAPVKKEEPAVAAPKALSFKEMMELKKKQKEATESAQQSPAPSVVQQDAKPAPILALDDTTTPKQAEPKEISTAVSTAKPELSASEIEESMRTGMLDPRLDPNITPKEEVSTEIAQAAADIKAKINLLNEKSGEDLPNAMKELKAALMKNPAAVDLMEDTDIGKMVIALRKITGEAIADAAKEKKPGRKPKNVAVDLTDPSVVAQIFDEL